MSYKEKMMHDNATMESQLQLQLLPPASTETTTPRNNLQASSNVVSRRPRGRPPGAKNKAKAPVVITHNIVPKNVLYSHVLEIAAGSDMSKSILEFVRHRGMAICILSGNGAVSRVTLRKFTGKAVTFKGKYEIVSISGTIFPPSIMAGAGGLSICLSGPKGQVVGGTVMSSLVAFDLVTLTVASFAYIASEKMPFVAYVQEEHGGEGGSGYSCGGGGGGGGGGLSNGEGSTTIPRPLSKVQH